MSSPETSEVRAVAEAIRSNDRFLLVTHENPDGDALGSILGMQHALEQLGKLRRELPMDAHERVLLALDCANAKRTGLDGDSFDRFPLTLDVDHHHDNTRFGRLNLIVPHASSTGEIVRD